MRVLITGGAGFIGSHTADLLSEKGHDVRILDSLSPPVHLPDVVPDYLSEDFEFIHGDVRNKEVLNQALQGVDAIIHLAAYQDYLPDFSKFFHINSVGTSLLYELIVEHNYPIKKIIVASSQAVYGEGKYRCDEHGVQFPPQRSDDQLQRNDWEIRCQSCGAPLQTLLSDEDVVNPHNPYAISKYSQELIALNLGRRYGIPSVCMRYSITQGPRQSFRNAYSGILRIFTLRLLNEAPPLIYEDGKQLRDYVYVGDTARANLLALERPEADFEVINVGGANAISVNEYARLVMAKLSLADMIPLVPGQYRLGDTRHVVSDISKIKELIGWEPTTDLMTIIDEYIDWARVQPDINTDYFDDADRVMRDVGTVRATGEPANC